MESKLDPGHMPEVPDVDAPTEGADEVDDRPPLHEPLNFHDRSYVDWSLLDQAADYD